MDAYAFILEQLRADDYRRLSSYRHETDCTFETWLSVVARRLCLDYYRRKYGRARGNGVVAEDAHRERRRLADLVSTAVDSELPETRPGPGTTLDRTEILSALELTLSDLAARDRLLLRYRFEDELSAVQIRRLMRLPSVFHVYRRVNAILASCRRVLQRKGFRASDV